MTDLQIFVEFGKMIGLKIRPVYTSEFVYIEYGDYIPDEDCSRKTTLTSFGYDDIYFLSKFDLGGNLVEGYIHSHVCNGPNGLRQLIDEFEIAVKEHENK